MVAEGGGSRSVELVDVDRAVDGVVDGMTVMIGGWGHCGSPRELIEALARRRLRDLTVILAGSEAVEPLNEVGSIRHMITSFGSYAVAIGPDGPGPATERAFERRLVAGQLTVELCSQGVLAERIRAGGAGIPAFYVEQRAVGRFSSTGETREIDDRTCVLETGLRADVALIGASVADLSGNLAWRGGEANYNAVMAFAADLVVAQAFELVEVGGLAPEHVMAPAVLIDRVALA
jgi:3-oxoacid CoA-transferase A subunit